MLAHVIHTEYDALICDFAECYNIYDLKPLPARRVAAFFIGLPRGSRVKMKMSGQKFTDELLMNALILDTLNQISWQLGGNKSNRPKSVFELMTSEKPKKKLMSFETGADFDAYRQSILERINENG